jgi:hypothetical protein
MKNFESNPALSTGFIEKKEIPIRKPEDIIRFLREFNFGDRDESAQKAVGRFVQYMKTRGDEELLLNQPRLVDLFISELEKANFVEPGTISREKWTKQAKLALLAALSDFNDRAKKWRVKVGKKHPDWRGANS